MDKDALKQSQDDGEAIFEDLRALQQKWGDKVSLALFIGVLHLYIQETVNDHQAQRS